MSTPKCPECGKPSTGNFCQHCGAKLGGRFCNQCGAELGPGARFCNQCGEKLSGDARPAGVGGSGPPARGGVHREAAASVIGGQNLPWWIAGVAMFALIVFLGIRMVTPAGPGGAAAQPQPVAPFASGGSGTPPDLSSMTPREAADRLFDRVMRNVSANDSAQAQAFLPMALSAYERAMPLDHDGLFHLSLLNRVAGNLDAALADATQILDEDPNHLLGLLAAAEAATELEQIDEASAYYRHLLEVIDSETARALPEYEAHAQIVQSSRSQAEAFLAGR